MQTDKELLNVIKSAYRLKPREEFVSTTSIKLKHAARKIKRKKKIKHFSLASVSFAICAIAISLFFNTEKSVISNDFNTPQKANYASSTAFNNEDPLVYIYHTHNVESFSSETKMIKVYDGTRNITLVGEKLSESLKKRGINAIHDKTNITEMLNGKTKSTSEVYKISRVPLEKALANNEMIKMVFDIHRDSAKRDVTTINLNGKEYSKIAFIVSSSSVKYEENLKFAELLHTKVEETYPQLSRGVIIKNNPTEQSTYNQDLLDNSVLLEIGGTENNLDEEYRTVEILSGIINEIISK